MAFDFKKEYKEFYLPPRTPSIVTVPAMNFLAVRGQGDPNETVAAMEAYATEQGYALDFSQSRFHHEIYLSDVRRCKPEKLKTVIRQPIKQTE